MSSISKKTKRESIERKALCDRECCNSICILYIFCLELFRIKLFDTTFKLYHINEDEERIKGIEKLNKRNEKLI